MNEQLKSKNIYAIENKAIKLMISQTGVLFRTCCRLLGIRHLNNPKQTKDP